MEPDKKAKESTSKATDDLADKADKVAEVVLSYVEDYTVATQAIKPDGEMTLMVVRDVGGVLNSSRFDKFFTAAATCMAEIKKWYEGGAQSWMRPCPFYFPGAVVELRGVGVIVVFVVTPQGDGVVGLDELQLAQQLVAAVEDPNTSARALVCLAERANESFAESGEG